MRSISGSSAKPLTLSLPCQSQPWHGSAPALSPDSEVPRSRTGSGAKGLQLFSDLQHGCTPSLLDHTPRWNKTGTQQGTLRGQGQALPNTSTQVWRDSWLLSYTSLHDKPALFIRAVKKVVCKWVILNFPFFLFGKLKQNCEHAH